MSRTHEARISVIATFATQVTDLDNSGRANPEKYHRYLHHVKAVKMLILVIAKAGTILWHIYTACRQQSRRIRTFLNWQNFQEVSRFPRSSGNPMRANNPWLIRPVSTSSRRQFTQRYHDVIKLTFDEDEEWCLSLDEDELLECLWLELELCLELELEEECLWLELCPSCNIKCVVFVSMTEYFYSSKSWLHSPIL